MWKVLTPLRPRGNPNNSAVISQRQHKIMRYWLHGLGPEEIRVILKIAPVTVYRDLKKIKDRLAKRVEVSDLTTLAKIFARLEEEYREAWVLYHRPARLTKKGELEDDRLVKALLLDRVHRVNVEEARLAGYYSPKVLERITAFETQAGRGIRIERIPFDEQLRLGVEELEQNEGLARSQGITSETFTEKGAS